jgi:O-antigen/teichoic acid export membrane protein
VKTEFTEVVAYPSPPLEPRVQEEALTRGRHLARSASLNLIGEALPLLAGLVCMRFVVRGLGLEAFGLLSIAWMLLGYFSLFDLGLGRATTKFVAEILGRGETAQLNSLINTSLVFQLAFGILGGLVLAASVPIFVHKVFRISAPLVTDARLTLFILAAGLPFVLIMNCLRGVLEAAQRFDLINLIKIPANSALFVLPAVLAPLGVRLPMIVLLLVLVRVGAMLTYFRFCLNALTLWRVSPSLDAVVLSRLIKYGGWVTATNLVGPILVYMDRLFIGSMLTVTAVGFYAAPAELMNRMLIVPVSLAAALFPAFSSMDALGAREKIQLLYGRAIKYVLLTLGPLLLIVAVFARVILQLWLGTEFATRSTTTLEILAFGVLVNALGYLPYVLLQAMGRPDIPACFHLLELPFYAGLLWILVHRFGVPGAALAWAVRVTLDAGLLFAGSAWLRLHSFRVLNQAGLIRSVLGVAAFATAILSGQLVGASCAWYSSYSGLVTICFIVGLWQYLLDSRDRELLTSTVTRLLSRCTVV